MHELPRRPADLPDAVVRPLPVALEVVEQLPLERPRVVLRGYPVLTRDMPTVEHLASHVQLEPTGNAVAHAGVKRAAVSRELVEFRLGHAPASVDRVRDLEIGRVTRNRPE